ncbi:MAG: DUF721 domain-containing protein [Saprospiraceae bacterium]|nr:DUF721 domain-containing protein [Saprospiraceae bacterium]
MKKKADQTLKDVMKDMFKEFKLENKLQETQIKSVWQALMGPGVDTYTSAIRLKDGVLTLTIVSAPLKQELTFDKERIRLALNEALGGEVVNTIVIR